MREITYTDKQATAAAQSSIDPVLLAQGYDLLAKEKEYTFRQALRYHWRALLWSMFLSMALVMDGYDGAIINSFFALPSFLARFGIANDAGVKSIPADYQTAFTTVGIPGAFLGLFLCGWGQERFGSRKTYLCGMAACIAIVFLFVFANSLAMLLGAQAIAAGAWALFNTLSAAYAAEICPIQLRGLAASYISMCWGMGGFIASGVNRGALAMDASGLGDWGWRMAYMVQWVWPIPLFIGCYWAPESPWWLVRKGHVDEAKRTLVRIATPGYWDSRNIDAYIAVIKHTDEIEKLEAAKGSFWDLWRGTNLRRTEIQMGVWAMQVLSGTAMTAYAVQFLTGAGLSSTAAFNLNIIITAMNLVGCGIEFGLITRFGRRPLILVGMCILAISLLIIGILGTVDATTATLAGTGVCCAIINLVYHASVGPLTYTVASEVPASRIRARSVAFGRAFYVIAYNSTNQLTPRMVSTGIGGWAWKGKAAYFWLGLNLLITTWAFFRMPETGGFSFADLDVLFANKVSAREFTKVKIVRVDEEPISKDEEAKHETMHIDRVELQ